MNIMHIWIQSYLGHATQCQKPYKSNFVRLRRTYDLKFMYLNIAFEYPVMYY